jgi:hypothetical protein
VKTNVRRWLPAIVLNRTRSALLGLAALGVIGVAVATGTAHQGSTNVSGSAMAANIATADKGALVRAADKASEPSAAQKAAGQATAGRAAGNAATGRAAASKAAADEAATAKAAAATPPPPPAPAEWWLTNSDVELQPNFYYCGPAATRIALSTHGKAMSFDQLASLLGTTQAGTSSAFDVTRVLNGLLGANRYHTSEIPGQKATPQQMDKLQADIVAAVSQGDPVVANVAGTVTDTDGDVHSYEGGHYLSVIGYADHGRMTAIGDPADPGKPTYKLSTIDLANWIASRGYSS